MYVGETKRPLKVRIAEHKPAVHTKKNFDYAIAHHYERAKHASLKLKSPFHAEAETLSTNSSTETRLGFLH